MQLGPDSGDLLGCEICSLLGESQAVLLQAQRSTVAANMNFKTAIDSSSLLAVFQKLRIRNNGVVDKVPSHLFIGIASWLCWVNLISMCAMYIVSSCVRLGGTSLSLFFLVTVHLGIHGYNITPLSINCTIVDAVGAAFILSNMLRLFYCSA